jgi:uncharacterized membrane protein (UPF0182 family)
VKNLFDEFMEELRRRQEAQSSGGDPNARPAGRRRTDDPADDSEAIDEGPDADEPRTDDDPADADEPRADEDSPAAERDDPDEAEPEPIHARPRPGGRGRGGRGPGGPRRPRSGRTGGPDDGAPRLRDRLRGVGLAVLIFGVLAIITVAGVLLDLVTDAIWYRSVGYDAVFFTRLGTQAALFTGVLVAVLLFLGLNIWLAGRLAPPPDPARAGTVGGFATRLGEALGVEAARPGQGPGGRSTFGGAGFGSGGQARTITFEADELPDLVPIVRWVIVGLAVVIALATAASAAAHWETVLLWRNQVPFAPTGPVVADPIFGRDVGYYLFELPFLRAGQALFNGLLIAALALSIGRYLLAGARGGLVFTTQMRLHLAILGGLYLLSVAVGYQLDKLELVYSTQGVATGVSFTDQNARFLAFDVLTAISAFAGAFLIIGAFTRAMWPLAAVVIVWLSASVVLGTLYPGLVQRLQVEPDQLNREAPFIANNIRMTRIGFDVADWERRDYSGEAPLTADAIDKEDATFQNARLWDYRPLRDTLDQLQTVRQYYDFTDVDTDRYRLADIPRQVMLSARELAPEKNTRGGTWVNQRITFTHGIGVAMVPVNAATEGGQPELIIRDLPPVSSAGAPKIEQPRIYFGERLSDWIVTGARQSEFDYPVGSTATDGSAESGQTTRWTGSTGVRLDTTLSRLLFALRFRDLNLLISDQVTSDSQLLFHRSLADRLPRIAPFLRFDKDPYLVVTDDGRLVYVQDAYTTSDRFPNAQWFDPTTLGETKLGSAPFNYIRNSVKIVEDAYTGEMTFYVSDADDPIVRTYQRIFPTLFKPLEAIPADLRSHLRVPEEMFNVQTRTFARYHVQDPSAFYNNEDLWTVPAGTTSTQALANEAYYVVMRMPGETDPEFLLLQPMVPSTRPNMIAWVAARMDQPNYGAVRVYQFPQNTSVLGPTQIEAKIDADPIIAAQTTLWDQSGSNVIRGNLIVMPIQDSLIYLQPVYLQSANSAFPEFQRIVVATSQKIVWGRSLSEALGLLLAGGSTPPPTPSPSPSPTPGASPTPASSAGPGATPPSGDVAALVAYANDHFERAQAALRAGDFATYGQEIAKVQDALRQLDALVKLSPAP